MVSGGYDFIITTDRTMMSNHHGKEFIGFLATGPAYFFPERVWLRLCCPKPKVDKEGKPIEAPYGLRKVEAALIDAGYRAAIIDPDHLEKHLRHAKAVLVGHHDFFAYGPPSSEWWLITGREPINRISLMRLMRWLGERKRRYGFKIIVGGPAAWQWLWEPEFWHSVGVDTVVDGEAEIVIKKLAEKVLNGEPLPKYVYVGAVDVPSVDEIPVIKGASVNGLVEVMRGCPRGCKFCSVTLRPLRFMPYEKIEAELRVNRDAGVIDAIIHSEDVLLYRAKGVIPQEEPLIKLHKLFTKYTRSIAWAHASLAAIVTAQRNGKIITKITDIVYSENKQDYLGVEVGIETGSVRLVRLYMAGKAAPYPPEKYPEIVEEAFAIMHEHRIVPAATFILNLPGERPEDVMATVELLERLRPYRSLIVPMFFVPMGSLKGDKRIIARVRVTPEHLEAFRVAIRHSAYWAKDIMAKFYLKGPKHALTRFLLARFVNLVESKAMKVLSSLEHFEGRELTIERKEVPSIPA